MTKTVDWVAIEADYRAGIKSVRAISAAHGITHRAIQKRAERAGWERDLAERIRAKAQAQVARRDSHPFHPAMRI